MVLIWGAVDIVNITGMWSVVVRGPAVVCVVVRSVVNSMSGVVPLLRV